MHAKSGLRVVLKWEIYRPDSVIANVIRLSHGVGTLTRMMPLLLVLASAIPG